jgi:hypothetical protein
MSTTTPSINMELCYVPDCVHEATVTDYKFYPMCCVHLAAVTKIANEIAWDMCIIEHRLHRITFTTQMEYFKRVHAATLPTLLINKH